MKTSNFFVLVVNNPIYPKQNNSIYSLISMQKKQSYLCKKNKNPLLA